MGYMPIDVFNMNGGTNNSNPTLQISDTQGSQTPAQEMPSNDGNCSKLSLSYILRHFNFLDILKNVFNIDSCSRTPPAPPAGGTGGTPPAPPAGPYPITAPAPPAGPTYPITPPAPPAGGPIYPGGSPGGPPGIEVPTPPASPPPAAPSPLTLAQWSVVALQHGGKDGATGDSKLANLLLAMSAGKSNVNIPHLQFIDTANNLYQNGKVGLAVGYLRNALGLDGNDDPVKPAAPASSNDTPAVSAPSTPSNGTPTPPPAPAHLTLAQWSVEALRYGGVNGASADPKLANLLLAMSTGKNVNIPNPQYLDTANALYQKGKYGMAVSDLRLALGLDGNDNPITPAATAPSNDTPAAAAPAAPSNGTPATPTASIPPPAPAPLTLAQWSVEALRYGGANGASADPKLANLLLAMSSGKNVNIPNPQYLDTANALYQKGKYGMAIADVRLALGLDGNDNPVKPAAASPRWTD